MNLKFRMTAAALTAVMLFTAGCTKKPVETAASQISESVTVSDTVPAETTAETTEETVFTPEAELGSGAFSCRAGNYVLKNNINIDAVIRDYEGVKGLDSGWHGDKWIDVTAWLTEFHSCTIDDGFLKGDTAKKRYHEAKGANDVTVKFVPFKEIGKKNYDGFETPAEVPVTLVNIEITLGSGLKIVIADAGNDDEFSVSGSGRGWYMTHDQIAAAEFLLELLDKDPSKDPLSDMIGHNTKNNTNTYTF